MSSRAKLNKLVYQLRRHDLTDLDPLSPQGFKNDTILFDGKLVTRKRIILNTIGCQTKGCTMCPFPNESSENITDQHLMRQFDTAFSSDESYEMITVFCNGNHFNDKEIPEEARRYMFEQASRRGAKYFVCETLPQFITEEKIKAAKEALGKTKLVVFTGFQSANDTVRKLAINTTLTKESFERAFHLLTKYDYILAAFVMFKPPFFATDNEASGDCLDSFEYLNRLGVKHVTLCPMRVAKNTLAEDLYKKSLYKPAWLWSIVDLILEAHHNYSNVTLMVNTTELKQQLNDDSVCISNSCTCETKVIEAIERYLYSRDSNPLTDIWCDCCLEYAKDIHTTTHLKEWELSRLIEERVDRYLESLE